MTEKIHPYKTHEDDLPKRREKHYNLFYLFATIEVSPESSDILLHHHRSSRLPSINFIYIYRGMYVCSQVHSALRDRDQRLPSLKDAREIQKRTHKQRRPAMTACFLALCPPEKISGGEEESQSVSSRRRINISSPIHMQRKKQNRREV